MGRDGCQEALICLLKKVEEQGYVTFDNIIDYAEVNNLPIQNVDWIANEITAKGIIIYDVEPVNQNSQDHQNARYDDYAQIDYDVVYSRIMELDNTLTPFVMEIRNIKPPQRGELSVLSYQVLDGNQYARKRMIEMHLRLAVKIALQRVETFDIDIQEAIGDACMGLITAVDKYNPDTNGAFASYAAMWIMQSISRNQTPARHPIYYPAHKKEPYFLAYSLLKANGFIFTSNIVKSCSAKKLLKTKLNFSDEEVREVLVMMIPCDSLENCLEIETLGGNNGRRDRLQEFFTDENSKIEVEANFLRDYIHKVLATLTDREKAVINFRYGLLDDRERTLEDVGQKFGLTRERIRQIEAKALKKLRHPSRSKGLKGFN